MISKILREIKLSFTDWTKPSFPVGWSVLGKVIFIIISIIIAIIVAPYVNYKFEQESRRSAFYTSTIDALNNDTKELIAKFNLLHEKTIGIDKKNEIFLDLKTDISKLQWRSVEFSLIYQREIDPYVARYQASLEGLDGYLDASDYGTQVKPDPIIEEFGISSARLLEFLAKKAGVQDF
jgi:hypothetical protein